MDGLDGEIREVLSRFGPQAGMPEVLAAWPAAVGPMVAANAWPARIARDGTLHVNTSSSAWAFELGQLAPEILERLSEKLGDSAPESLRFAVGHLPEPAPEAPAQARTEFPSRPRKPYVGRPSSLPGSRTKSCEIECKERSLSASRRARPTTVSDTLLSARK